MTKFVETIRLCHNAIVSASETITSSRSHAIAFAVCIEIILLMMFLSAWPLWWFLLKAGIILAAVAVVAELALRFVYWRKDRRTEKGVSKPIAIAGTSPRLDVACSDAQGQLRNPHIPEDQVNRMAQAILRDHLASQTPTAFRIGNLKFRALTRFIHSILNWNGE